MTLQELRAVESRLSTSLESVRAQIAALAGSELSDVPESVARVMIEKMDWPVSRLELAFILTRDVDRCGDMPHRLGPAIRWALERKMAVNAEALSKVIAVLEPHYRNPELRHQDIAICLGMKMNEVSTLLRHGVLPADRDGVIRFAKERGLRLLKDPHDCAPKRQPAAAGVVFDRLTQAAAPVG